MKSLLKEEFFFVVVDSLVFVCRLDALFLCKIRGMIYGSLFLRLLVKRSSKYRKRGENEISIVANLVL